jgi:DNA repair protein RadA/Sms
VQSTLEDRIRCGIGELDRVLGGGVVPGSLTLIGGDPGIGKSTLLLQAVDRLAEVGPALYVTAEECRAPVGLLRAQSRGAGSGQGGRAHDQVRSDGRSR